MTAESATRGALLLAFVFYAMGCASSTAVTRNVGGRLVRGRFVTDDAYAAYLRGSLLEAQGKGNAALTAYLEGVRQDPKSPEFLTRIGALSCTAQEGDDGGSNRRSSAAFERARAIDPGYEEAFTERARCHLKRGQLADAEQAARIAVALDPDRIEPAVLLALSLERQKRIDEATRWLDGLIVRDPASIEAQEAMLGFASRTHDDVRRATAERALAELGADAKRPSFSDTARASFGDIDAAIGRGQFDRARRLALSAHLSNGALAVRAAAVGAVSFATEQAELVLAADPADGDAHIAAAVAADLRRDDEAFARAMEGIDGTDTTISPLAKALMAELLDRRSGADAKKAWTDAVGALPNEDADALARDVATRH